MFRLIYTYIYIYLFRDLKQKSRIAEKFYCANISSNRTIIYCLNWLILSKCIFLIHIQITTKFLRKQLINKHENHNKEISNILKLYYNKIYHAKEQNKEIKIKGLKMLNSMHTQTANVYAAPWNSLPNVNNRCSKGYGFSLADCKSWPVDYVHLQGLLVT